MKKKYKTPNGSIVEESVLRQKYGDRFDALVSDGTFSEYADSGAPLYVTPNGSLVEENTLKSKYGNDFYSLVKSGTLKKKEEATGVASVPGTPNTDQFSLKSIASTQTPTLLSSQTALREQSAAPVEKNPYEPILKAAQKVYPDKVEQVYSTIVDGINSDDEQKKKASVELLNKLNVLEKTDDSRVMSPADKLKVKELTGVDDPQSQLAILRENTDFDANGQLTSKVRFSGVDLTGTPKQEIEKYIEKLDWATNKKVNDFWVNKDITVQGAKNTTELEDLMSGLGGLGGHLVVKAGQALTGDGKRYNDETINISLSTGIEAIKNSEPERYKRITNDILNGKALASSDVVELTALGAQIRMANNTQDFADDKKGYDDYMTTQGSYAKEVEDNVYKRPDYLRSMMADVIQNHYEKDGTIAFSKWMVTDKEIDAVPKIEFINAGLDPENPEFKKQLQEIKNKESWIPFVNSIGKDDLFREFKKGAMSVPQGVISTLEAANPFVSANELRNDQLNSGLNLTDVANRRGKYFQDNYGPIADAFQGFGQYASQVGLMLAGEGLVGAVGESLSGGTVASNLMNASRLQKFGNALSTSKGLYSTFGTSFVMSYGDYYKDALTKTDNPLTAKMMAFTNASMEGASETMFDNIEFGKQVAKDIMRKENFSKIAKIFDRGLFDEAAQKEYRENLLDVVKNTAKTFGKAGIGLTKEAFEEVPVALTNFVVDAAANPANVRGRDVMGEMKDSFLNGLVSFSIPSLLGLGGSLKQDFSNQNTRSQQALMISAMQRPYVVDAIQRLKDSGDISAEEADKKIKVVNTAQQQLAAMPDIKVDGSLLEADETKKYLTLSVQQKILEEKNKNLDEAAVAVNQQRIDEILKQKAEILTGNKGLKSVADIAVEGEPASKVYTEAEKLQIKADEINIAANNLPPEKMEEKKAMWKQANDLRQQAVELELAEKNKNESKPSDFVSKVREVLTSPKDESEAEKLRVADIQNQSDEELSKYAVQQSVDAPASSLKDVFNNDRELAIEAVSKNSEEDINASIKKWQQRTKDIPEGASEEEIAGVVNDVKENLSILREGLAKKQPAEKKDTGITQEAKDFLGTIKEGSTPVFITKNLEKIAKENGIKITPKSTAAQVVNELRKKNGQPPLSKAKQTKIDFTEAATEVPAEGQQKFTDTTKQLDELNKKIDESTDEKEVADLMQQRDNLYKELRGTLTSVEKPTNKSRVPSELLEIASEHGVSVENAAEIKNILDTSETKDEFLARYDELMSRIPRFESSTGTPQVTNFNLGRSDRKGEGFEDVMLTTNQIEGRPNVTEDGKVEAVTADTLVAYAKPAKSKVGQSYAELNQDGRVVSNMDKLGLEMFDDPNGKPITRRESLYEVLTGEGYSEQQRGMAAAYLIAQRMIAPPGGRSNTINNFNSRLWEKAGSKISIVYDDKVPVLAATPNGTIIINGKKLGERLTSYVRNGAGEKALLTWAEVAMNEEVLHLATFKVASVAELEQIHDELSDEEKKLVADIYQGDLNNKAALGAEYVRMVVQERVLGRISSHDNTVNNAGTVTEMFKPGMQKNKPEQGQPAPNEKSGIRAFMAKLVSYLKKAFVNTKSKTAKEVVARLNNYIANKPNPQVRTEAVVKQSNLITLMYGGKENLVEVRPLKDGTEGFFLVERDENGKIVDKVDPLKGSSLIGLNSKEAQDAIMDSTFLFGSSSGYIPMETMTASAALKQYPFLKELFNELEIKGAKKINIRNNGNVVTIKAPLSDYYVRHISWGKLDGSNVNTIYAGTSDVPQDLLSRGVEGEKKLNNDSFFAVADHGNNQVRIDLFSGEPNLLVGASSEERPKAKKLINTVSKRIGALELEDVLKTAEQKIKDLDEGAVPERYAFFKDFFDIFYNYRKMLADGASDNDIRETIVDLYNGYPTELIETLRDLKIINNEEAEILNAQTDESGSVENPDALLMSQLGFQLNASSDERRDELANRLWEQKQREKLDKETAKVAKDIKDGKISYEQATKGKDDAYLESLAAQVNQKLHNADFRTYVQALRDAGFSEAQVAADLSSRKKLSKDEQDIIKDEFANTYENDPAVQQLRDALVDLQAGRRPKSVAKRLLTSRVSNIIKLLKEFSYEKVTNKQLEDMADHILQNIDLKDVEKFVNSMNDNGLTDVKQLLRAKAILLLQKSTVAGSKAAAIRLTNDLANEATIVGRQTQSLRRVYELFHAHGSPEMKSNFAKQFLAAVNKKAEEKIAAVLKGVSKETDQYKKYIADTEKLNDEIHQEAIDKILESEMLKNDLQKQLDKICNQRLKKKK